MGRLHSCDKRNLKKGNLVLGPFLGQMFRAKILNLSIAINPQQKALLYYPYYGNSAEVYVDELRMMPPGCLAFPPFAHEAVLSGVAASRIRNPKGNWMPSATAWFKEQTIDKELVAKIFSVVDNVTSMDLE